MRKFVLLFSTILLGSATLSAQNQRVAGTVTGPDGNALAGVTVFVSGAIGAGAGAVTDGSGAYAINAPADATLEFAQLGMVTQRVAIDGRSTINVQLENDTTTLDEVVVVGYGVLPKKLVTGATVQVKGDKIAKLNTTSALGALPSQVPGVSITQSSGMPGSGFKVFVRGMGTIGTYSPLIVIDGVAAGTDANTLTSLNPADIESLDVLKDAASAAIYGSRAANGVILVTTKQGRKGRVQVSLDGYYGWQNPYRMPDMLNAQEYMMIINEATMMDGNPAVNWENYFNTPYLKSLYDGYMDGSNKGTDWVSASRNKNAPTRNYTFNVTGGSDVSVFSLGLGYTAQEGIFGYPQVPSWERYTARLNSEYTLFKGSDRDIVKFGENLIYNHGRSGQGIRNGTSMYWSDLYSLMRIDPLTPIYDENGEWFGSSVINPQLDNPVGLTQYNRGDLLDQSHGLRTNVYLTVEPIKNLVFKSVFGYNLSFSEGRSYSPIYKVGSSNRTMDSVSQDMSSGYSWNVENTLTYKFDIGENNHFTALLGQSAEKWGMGSSLNASNGNPKFHDFEHAYINNTLSGNLVLNDATSMGGSPWGMGRLASFFGRVSYDYKYKYMATVVLRADGSSNFMRGNRWGYFPSISAGWVVTEESFMTKSRGWLDFLKLRASWGQNGNSSIPNFQYLGTIASGAPYNFGSDKAIPTPGSYADVLPNYDISWETSEQIDFGIDARFLGSRLGLTFDYYIKNTKDWLINAPQLASYGTGAPYINGGDIRNSGVELAFDWSDNIGEFQYGANLNMAYNKNEVTHIANKEKKFHGSAGAVFFEPGSEFYRVEVGYPVGYFLGYKTNGIFQNQAQIDAYNAAHKGIQADARPGDVIWQDSDGNDVIDDGDKVMLGKAYPDFNLGLNLNFAYKGFDLNFTMNGVFGGQIMRSWRNWGIAQDNYTSEILGRWHGEGTSNRLPKVSMNPAGNMTRISDLYMENGDYFRMQNVTLGYDFKKLLPSAKFLSQLRVYVAVQNLFTITGYSGMDPELGQTPDNNFSWASGIDAGYYPNPRTWMVGANFKF